MSKADWVWMPHAAHLIISNRCQFFLATYLGNGYLVSTVGEYWPERMSREIHAKIHDPKWHAENNHLMGDAYDHAYMKRFGFEDIGYDRKFETMVFYGIPAKDHPDGGCDACRFVIVNGEDLDFDAYNEASDAVDGHMAMCTKWGRKRTPKSIPAVIPRAERLEQVKKATKELQEILEKNDNKD